MLRQKEMKFKGEKSRTTVQQKKWPQNKLTIPCAQAAYLNHDIHRFLFLQSDLVHAKKVQEHKEGIKF